MDRFFGLIGICIIFVIAFLMSNNKRKINLKTVIMGFLLQVLLAVFVLKTTVGQVFFGAIGKFISKILAPKLCSLELQKEEGDKELGGGEGGQ